MISWRDFIIVLIGAGVAFALFYALAYWATTEIELHHKPQTSARALA
jgi:hypothetical protein